MDPEPELDLGLEEDEDGVETTGISFDPVVDSVAIFSPWTDPDDDGVLVLGGSGWGNV